MTEESSEESSHPIWRWMLTGIVVIFVTPAVRRWEIVYVGVSVALLYAAITNHAQLLEIAYSTAPKVALAIGGGVVVLCLATLVGFVVWKYQKPRRAAEFLLGESLEVLDDV